jgi:hypothetical protein
MQGHYPAEFDREQGFSEADWQRCLPGAVGGRPLDLRQPGEARVAVGTGTLLLRWQVMPPRQIALARILRLAVQYRFDGVPEAERQAFMRYFDLYTQRGGG